MVSRRTAPWLISLATVLSVLAVAIPQALGTHPSQTSAIDTLTIAAVECEDGEMHCVSIASLTSGSTTPPLLSTPLTVELPGTVEEVAMGQLQQAGEGLAFQYAYVATVGEDSSRTLHRLNARAADPGSTLFSVPFAPDNPGEHYEVTGLFPMEYGVVALAKRLQTDPVIFREGIAAIVKLLGRGAPSVTTLSLGRVLPSDLAYLPEDHPTDFSTKALIAATEPDDDRPQPVFIAQGITTAPSVRLLTQVDLGVPTPTLDASLHELLYATLRLEAPEFMVRLRVVTEEGTSNTLVSFRCSDLATCTEDARHTLPPGLEQVKTVLESRNRRLVLVLGSRGARPGLRPTDVLLAVTIADGSVLSGLGFSSTADADRVTDTNLYVVSLSPGPGIAVVSERNGLLSRVGSILVSAATLIDAEDAPPAFMPPTPLLTASLIPMGTDAAGNPIVPIYSRRFDLDATPGTNALDRVVFNAGDLTPSVAFTAGELPAVVEHNYMRAYNQTFGRPCDARIYYPCREADGSVSFKVTLNAIGVGGEVKGDHRSTRMAVAMGPHPTPAVLIASPERGIVPLTVSFDASGSAPPDQTVAYEFHFPQWLGLPRVHEVNTTGLAVYEYRSPGVYEPSVLVLLTSGRWMNGRTHITVTAPPRPPVIISNIRLVSFPRLRLSSRTLVIARSTELLDLMVEGAPPGFPTPVRTGRTARGVTTYTWRVVNWKPVDTGTPRGTTNATLRVRSASGQEVSRDLQIRVT